MSLTLSGPSITGHRTLAPTSATPFAPSTPSSQGRKCKVYVGAETRFSHESNQVIDCLQRNNIYFQDGNLSNATHYFLFVTDSYLKSKEHVLPLINALSDPHFKQRLFPVIMDKKIAIFSPGNELNYVEYWGEILKNTNATSSEYGEVMAIKNNIASFICALRDTLMPPLAELLQINLAPIIDTIGKRSHLLETKRFFFVPAETNITTIYGRDTILTRLSSLFANKDVVTVSGESGIGKTTLAIEYAKRSENYPSGIFWLNAKDEQSLDESFRQLAVQLGMNFDQAKKELHQMKDFLLIYDNVVNSQQIPHFPSAQSLVIGANLTNSDIKLDCLVDTDAERCIQDQLNTSVDEARSLAKVLENHPGKIIEAIAYIKSSKIAVPKYVDYYLNEHDSLIAKQRLQQQIKGSSAPSQLPLASILDPLPQTIEKFIKQSVSHLSQELKNQEIQIFVSYNWGAKDQVEQIDSTFKGMGIELLRDARELSNFDSIREFMKKVIRQADYTFSVINNAYLKSFNCLFEVITTMQDPYWRNRVFPIVLPEVTLDDQKIAEIEAHWQQETARLEKASGTPAEIAIAKESAKKIAPYLQFVRQLQPEVLSDQLSTKFQKSMALMLARQEVLEKKGIYKQAIFHLPMGRNKDFTGRDREMVKLEESLKQGQYSAITNTGMGGVGKSQMALEYAYRHQKEYEMLYWIRSEDMGTIKSDLRMLGLEKGIAEDFLKDDKVISTMKGVLEKQKNWLLVFDNAEDPKALAAVMPQRGGHIIVTSRNKNWDKAVSIDVFSKEESLRYLQKISGVSNQDKQLEILAEELGYLPLALTQAGAYIRKQQIDVATYRAAYKEGQKKMLSQKERGYPGSVATAWLMSMEKITKEDSNAAKLLNICSFLAPDNIPESVLHAWLKDKNKMDSELDFQDALRILESYSLIDQKVEQKEGTYHKKISIHRLIQAVTRDECKKDEINSVLELGIDVLNQQFTGNVETKGERETGETLVEHAKALNLHAEEANLITEKTGNLANKIGSFLCRTGDLKGAMEIHQKAIKIKIACLGTEAHTSVANSYNFIGVVLQAQGDLKGALEMYQKAVKIHIASLGKEEHTSVATSYTCIGSVLQAQSDLKGAMEMHQKVLKIAIACFGKEEHPSVASSYHNIGFVLQAQGDLKGALEMYRKGLNILIACLGTEEHTSVACSYNNIGNVLADQGDLKGALEMYRKAVKIYIACLGTDNHPNVAESYSNMGNVLRIQGEFKETMEMYLKQVKIFIACLGTEEHTSVARSYNNMGIVLMVQGDLKGALEMYQKALKIKIACLGTEDHASVAESYGSIGIALRDQGDYKGAMEMFQNALKIFIACLGTDVHTSVADTYYNMGFLLRLQRDLKGAMEMFQKAVKIYIARLGTEVHTNVATSYENMGLMLMDQEDLNGALEMHKKALKIKIACLGTEEHTSVAISYSSIGSVLLYQGDLKEAMEMFQKDLKITIACLGTEEHTSVAQCYMNFGDVSLLSKQNKQAKEYYLKAKQICFKKEGDKNNAFFDHKIKECDL